MLETTWRRSMTSKLWEKEKPHDECLSPERPSMTAPGNRTVDLLLYDGQCAFCSSSVQFILKREKRKTTAFAPFYSETYYRVLLPEEREALPDSLIVIRRNGEILDRSTAALYIGLKLKSPWRELSKAGLTVPEFLRDGVYRIVAACRKKLVRKDPGKCLIPTEEQKKRFLP